MSKPTSLRLDANMATSAVFDMLRQMRSPAKSLRTVVLKEGTVALLIESFQFELCVSRSSSEKIYSMERRKIGIETRRQILQGHLAPNKNSGKKGSIAMHYSKVRLMSVVLARLSSRTGHRRKPCTKKRCARGVAVTWRKTIYKLKNADKAAFYTSVEARTMLAPTSKSPEEREFVADLGASMHMLSKKKV